MLEVLVTMVRDGGIQVISQEGLDTTRSHAELRVPVSTARPDFLRMGIIRTSS